MCVAISMDPGTELTEEEVLKMNRSNADGAGFAWARDGVVHWFKTKEPNPFKFHRMVNYWRDYPRLVHFRLSTAGGVKDELCHPFEIGPMASAASIGKGNKVMIHNGHWGRWGDVFDIMKKEQLIPDSGPWSDTRLGAWLASFDEDWLDTMEGRVATLDGAGNRVLRGAWEGLRDGIKVSNKYWDHDYNYTRSGKDRNWRGWGWTEKQWENWEAHQKEIHEQEEAAREVKAIEAGQKEADLRVGVGPDDSAVSALRVAKGSSTVQTSTGGTNGTTGASATGVREHTDTGSVQKEETKKWDNRPFYHSRHGKWYRVLPGTNGRVVELSEGEARAALGEAATSHALARVPRG